VRRNLAMTLLGIGVLLVGAGGHSNAVEIPVPHLIAAFYGGVEPRLLPRDRPAPAALTIHGKFSTVEGSQPPAFREALVDFDRAGVINARGLPVCRLGQLAKHSSQAARRTCGEALIGTGTADVEASLERLPATLTAFNGGTSGGTTTIFVHAALTGPFPAPSVTVVKIKKIHDGRYGSRAVWKIPPILKGRGSVRDFRLSIKRRFEYRGVKQSYVTVRCPSGTLVAHVTAVFKDEANSGIGDQTVGEDAIRDCTPQG